MNDVFARAALNASYEEALKGVQMAVGLHTQYTCAKINITSFVWTHNIINILNGVLSAQLDQISNHLYYIVS